MFYLYDLWSFTTQDPTLFNFVTWVHLSSSFTKADSQQNWPSATTSSFCFLCSAFNNATVPQLDSNVTLFLPISSFSLLFLLSSIALVFDSCEFQQLLRGFGRESKWKPSFSTFHFGREDAYKRCCRSVTCRYPDTVLEFFFPSQLIERRRFGLT